MRILRLALADCGIVFGAGLVLGTVRVLRVAPRLGSRTAELLEMPLMLAATLSAALWIAGRAGARGHPREGLAIGAIGIVLLIAAELLVGVAMRRMSVWESLFQRDPVAGTAYYASLAVFAMAPWLMSRRLAAPGAGRGGGET